MNNVLHHVLVKSEAENGPKVSLDSHFRHDTLKWQSRRQSCHLQGVTMPHQISLMEMLANFAGILFGLWVFFPLIAIKNILDGPGKLGRQVRKIPLGMFIFWSFFAFWRVILFIYPVPVYFAIVPEPVGTYLFFLAGVAVLLMWWAVDLRGRRPALRSSIQPTPVGSFSIPTTQQARPPFCSKCGAPMVVRTAKQGRWAGEQFYGCSNFPKCKETQAI
jgi:hypothetical protein